MSICVWLLLDDNSNDGWLNYATNFRVSLFQNKFLFWRCQIRRFSDMISRISANRNWCQKSKISSKLKIFVKNRNFCENPNSGQNSTFSSRIEIFVKIEIYFQKTDTLDTGTQKLAFLGNTGKIAPVPVSLCVIGQKIGPL